MINLSYRIISLISLAVNKKERFRMRLIVSVLFIAFSISACSTQNYLTQTNHSSTIDKSGLVTTKTALERPMISSEELQAEILINHANTAEDIKKNIFVSNLESSFQNILTKAKSYLGTPYRYGGTTRNGIDCSAFIQQIYEVEGIELPRVSSRQAKIGKPVSRNELQKGDLIFFSTTHRYRITHVAMVMDVDQDGVTFIHSGSSKGVSIESLNHPYWDKRYREARRPEKFVQPMLVKASDLDSIIELASKYP